MKVLSATFRMLDRLVNPIVVKELRQAVNGRFVSAALILLIRPKTQR